MRQAKHWSNPWRLERSTMLGLNKKWGILYMKLLENMQILNLFGPRCMIRKPYENKFNNLLIKLVDGQIHKSNP